MRKGGHVYYHVKPFEYLVIQESERQGWYRVLLQNGAYGYVSTDKVAQLPYQVTTSNQRGRNAPLAARSAAVANSFARESLQYIGTPYVWGGDDLRS